MSFNRRELLAAALAAGVCLPGSRAVQASMIGTALPKLPLVDGEGKTRSLDEWKGRPLFLAFWATWCRPCITELPKLDRLHRRLEAAGTGRLLTVCVDEVPVRKVVASLMTERGYTMPVYFESTGAAAKEFGVDVLPVSWLVDADGVVRSRVVGGREWDDQQWVTALERLGAPGPG